MKTNTIIDLLYGNPNPIDYITNDKDFINFKLDSARDQLLKNLTEEEKKLLKQVEQNTEKLSLMNETEAFKNGFSLACKILIEALD